MRKLLFFFILISIPITNSFSQGPQPTTKESSGLEEIMDELKSNAKAIRPILPTPEKYEQIIVNAQSMQKLAVQAMSLCPEAPSVAEENKTIKSFEWEIGYKRSMLAVADLCLQLELALHLKDSEKAQEIYRNLGAVKKEGHNTYDP